MGILNGTVKGTDEVESFWSEPFLVVVLGSEKDFYPQIN